MTDHGFGALMCKKCAQSRGWRGDTIGGGGGWWVGEPRPGIIYLFVLFVSQDFT